MNSIWIGKFKVVFYKNLYGKIHEMAIDFVDFCVLERFILINFFTFGFRGIVKDIQGWFPTVVQKY